MSWIFLAIIGHLFNAAAFIVDKCLLSRAFKQSGTYAALIGSLSLLAMVAIPWIGTWPRMNLLPIVFGFGGTFVFGLWTFFESLKHHEASRVVPVIGSLVPMITLMISHIVFHERLTERMEIGFVLLLVSTFLLTSTTQKKHATHMAWTHLMTMIFSATCFATAMIFGKIAFEKGEFLAMFVSSRMAAGFVGISIGLLIPAVRKEILSMIIKPGRRFLFPSDSVRNGRKNKKNHVNLATTWMLFGQVCGSLGFVLIHLALISGSASIINALQAVQYATIVLVAWFAGTRLRRILQEPMQATMIMQKGLAIVLTAIGLGLVT